MMLPGCSPVPVGCEIESPDLDRQQIGLWPWLTAFSGAEIEEIHGLH